ncbi:peroxide stress protein YaaA [Gallaecimonas kandeliae]|uniref:peroxide stress protein YaaA n=1 Tax=Gallaecimonas kandeliae TaxID=3029055 RepID=UPI00264A3B31|nr:peroxide stress protein YaaA [Gallaecimonas kandeliae]WKE66366.1 peroxide stress protein YaaA [Gallaecimonas kandeliae]
MLMLVSPAKSLDFETPPTTDHASQPELLDHSQALIEVCRTLTPAQLSSLMSISDKLAGLNAARFADWQLPFTPANAKQAMLAFTGDVYTGLDAGSLDDKGQAYVQKHLRILSGLYGLLKPLDLIQAYRLEMGTSLKNPRGKDLYAFWGELITAKVNEALAQSGNIELVNLASTEYFKSVKPRQVQGRLITPVFKDEKNGKYKIISFYAKKARGMMVRYAADNNVQQAEALKAFDYGGYCYSPEQSKGDTWVFLRHQQD